MGNKFSVTINNKKYDVEVYEKEENVFLVKVGNREYIVYLPREFNRFENTKEEIINRLSSASEEIVLEKSQQVQNSKQDIEQGIVIASEIPGKLIKLMIKEGEFIEQGQPIAIIESMKMAIEIKSPYRGRVKKIIAQEKSFIDIGKPILLLDSI